MLLDDVRAYLIAQGAVPSGWSIFEGYLPDDTDQVIALFETGGRPPDTLNRENEDVTFQVRVRSGRLDYPTARTKWQEVFNLLQDAQETAGSPALLVGYIYIQAAHDGPMTWSDDKARPNMTSNWRVKKGRS